MMVAPWNVLCVLHFYFELILSDLYNIEIAFCIFIFEHSWHFVSTQLIGHNNFSLTPGFNSHFSESNSHIFFFSFLPLNMVGI